MEQIWGAVSDDECSLGEIEIFKNFINSLSTRICVKDLDGEYLFLNQGYADMISSSIEEATGKTDFYFLNREQAERSLKLDNKVKQLQQTMVVEESFEVADRKRYYKITRSPMLDGSKQIKGIIVWVEDVTLHKCLEQKAAKKDSWVDLVIKQIIAVLQKERAYKDIKTELYNRKSLAKDMKEVADISADWFVEIDEEGHYTRVNLASQYVLGWTEKELLTMKWQDHIHPEDYEATIKFIDGYLKEQTRKNLNKNEQIIIRKNFVNRYRCKDGSYRWFRWHGYRVKKHHNLVGVANDITYEKQLQLREETAERMMQLERIKSEFFANISHEFKTPLNIIMSAIKLLELEVKERGIEAIGITKNIGRIKQSNYRLLRLVNNLIDTTEMDLGDFKIYRKNVNIISIVEETVLSVVKYAERKSIEVIFDTEAEEEVIACDPVAIERVILNLLSNAIKYTAKSGRIEVNIKLQKAGVVISVEDCGTGIPDNKLEIIFESFTQADYIMTRECEGSGIGLSIVQSIVKMHGGTVKVQSEVGKGSRFEVILPRVQISEKQKSSSGRTANRDTRAENCKMEFSDIMWM